MENGGRLGHKVKVKGQTATIVHRDAFLSPNTSSLKIGTKNSEWLVSYRAEGNFRVKVTCSKVKGRIAKFFSQDPVTPTDTSSLKI